MRALCPSSARSTPGSGNRMLGGPWKGGSHAPRTRGAEPHGGAPERLPVALATWGPGGRASVVSSVAAGRHRRSQEHLRRLWCLLGLTVAVVEGASRAREAARRDHQQAVLQQRDGPLGPFEGQRQD